LKFEITPGSSGTNVQNNCQENSTSGYVCQVPVSRCPLGFAWGCVIVLSETCQTSERRHSEVPPEQVEGPGRRSLRKRPSTARLSSPKSPSGRSLQRPGRRSLRERPSTARLSSSKSPSGRSLRREVTLRALAPAQSTEVSLVSGYLDTSSLAGTDMFCIQREPHRRGGQAAERWLFDPLREALSRQSMSCP